MSASRVFPAAYEGTCNGCDGPIDIGDEIRMLDGVAHHEGCVDEEDLPWQERQL